jgi:hypothetical protein
MVIFPIILFKLEPIRLWDSKRALGITIALICEYTFLQLYYMAMARLK